MIKLLLCKLRPDDSVRVWSSYPSGRKDTPLFTLTQEQESESEFLCQYNNSHFVSNIMYNKEYGKYVDTGELAIQLSSLQAIYLIEKRVDNG